MRGAARRRARSSWYTPSPIPFRVLTGRCRAQIEAMDYREGGATSARAQQLTAALDDADRFAPPEAALQTRQLLGAIRCALFPNPLCQNLNRNLGNVQLPQDDLSVHFRAYKSNLRLRMGAKIISYRPRRDLCSSRAHMHAGRHFVAVWA